MFDFQRCAWPSCLVPAVLLGGCVAPPADADFAAVVSDNAPTVATVTWTSAVATRGRVEYGADADYGSVTPAESVATRSHRIAVIGLLPGDVAHLRVAETGADGETVGADHTVDLPAAPSSVPGFVVLPSADDAWGTYTAAAFAWPDDRGGGVVVLDPAAEVVWYRTEPVGSVPWVELGAEAGTIAYRVDDQADDGASRVVFARMDGESVTSYPTPLGHHAIAQTGLPGVRFAYIAAVVGEWEGEPVVGDRLVERMDDGSDREVWNAFDWIEVERNGGWEFGIYDMGADWTHANGVSYDAASDCYLLSLYQLDEVVAIDRSTGAMRWTLGGTHSDFTFVDDVGFHHQHAPEVHGDTLYVFDNGDGSYPTRVVSYALDTTAWTATPTWQWSNPAGDRTAVLGDVDVLPDDTILSAWGDVGQVNIAARDGTLLNGMDAEPGVVIGKAQRFVSLYPD
jgi:hypothetical protein